MFWTNKRKCVLVPCPWEYCRVSERCGDPRHSWVPSWSPCPCVASSRSYTGSRSSRRRSAASSERWRSTPTPELMIVQHTRFIYLCHASAFSENVRICQWRSQGRGSLGVGFGQTPHPLTFYHYIIPPDAKLPKYCSAFFLSRPTSLWPPYGIRRVIIFSSCGFYFLSFFFA